MREDIISLLRLHNPEIMVTGFNRANIYFEVQKPKDKFGALIAFLKNRKDKSGIVYCSTRNNVEEVHQKLIDNGYNASRYHAGISDKERYKNQDDFLYDRVQIIVATNAFGMGIDKSNVSFVVHYNMPKDIESYYQEAGRAGRDGEAVDCILLYSGQDVRTNLWLIENAKDSQNSNRLIEEELKERERKRLREITLYCATNDCLRGYILKYFGENPPVFCGNCSNCNSNFETADVTVEVQKILSCVYRMKERYGVKMLIDVLRGSKNEKIMRLGLDKLSVYGISEMNERDLRNIINYLILNNYIVKSDDQYPIIKLGKRAGDVLHGNESINIKLPKQETKIIETPKKKSMINPMDKELFVMLRDLRYQIASEQKVPAFVVFSDSTLTDMCMKIPSTDDELLSVSGVGQVKLERYGRRFLAVINDYVNNNQIIEKDFAVENASNSFDKSIIVISDDAVTISIIADRINTVIMQSGSNKINGAKINDWLISQGYMEKISDNKKNYKVPTEKGKKLGIFYEMREIRGETVGMNFYSREAQTLIVNSLESVLQFYN